MNRKVLMARLQTTIHIPGAGELGNVLPPSGKTLQDLQMTATELGLIVDFTVAGVKYESLIPSANIAIMRLAPEEKVAEKASKGSK